MTKIIRPMLVFLTVCAFPVMMWGNVTFDSWYILQVIVSYAIGMGLSAIILDNLTKQEIELESYLKYGIEVICCGIAIVPIVFFQSAMLTV